MMVRGSELKVGRDWMWRAESGLEEEGRRMGEL